MHHSISSQSARSLIDTDPLDGPADVLDHAAGAALASLTGGLSPTSLGGAWVDWWMHLAMAPGRQMHLGAKYARKYVRLLDYAQCIAKSGDRASPCIEPLPQDNRFRDPSWQTWPYNMIYQAFLLGQQWWDAATTNVNGVTPHHEQIMRFAARQMLDMLAPSNSIMTNPVIQKRIMETGGRCLADGAAQWLDDWNRLIAGERPAGADHYRPGHEVAITPGKVIYQNTLIELIQYTPSTDNVRPEPVLIVPAWIMKYYILDLSPEDSLVRWLVAQGFTVFMISWRNPGKDDRDLDLDAYRRMGVLDAIDAVCTITRAKHLHTAGYCLGGTLLAIAAAAMARDNDDRLASMTLFAAQVEFTDPGELGLFIDEGQVNFLENMMWARGYLDSHQMGGAFQLLRSNDLIWSRLIRNYLMGEKEPMNDLMAWNADGTRLPYAMHSEYLRSLFLKNELAHDRYIVEGKPVSLADITAPIFVVGTEWDHVAPWRSVFKIQHLTGTEVTFLLTSGGHNAGIVSEPGHGGRMFRVQRRTAGGHTPDPDAWLVQAEEKQGSWWPEWGAWLAQHSGEMIPPPTMGNPNKGYVKLRDAPGMYVLAA